LTIGPGDKGERLRTGKPELYSMQAGRGVWRRTQQETIQNRQTLKTRKEEESNASAAESARESSLSRKRRHSASREYH